MADAKGDPARADHSELDLWRPVLERLGLPRETVSIALRRAIDNGTTFQAELLVHGATSEANFFGAAARALGLPFLSDIDPARLIVSDRDGLALLRQPNGVRRARYDAGDGRTLTLLAPEAAEFAQLRRWMAERPALRQRFCLVAPMALRGALLARFSPVLATRAVNRLFEEQPDCSARTVFTGRQGFVLGAAASALVSSAIAWPNATFLAMHLLLTLSFLPCVALRLMATRQRVPKLPRLARCEPLIMPRYTILVALHREAEIVPELLVALGKLEWPRSKLEIKLVCEADDAETLAALRAQRLRPSVEVIAVPPGIPRTKPKALAYAMGAISGDFVALYDAEDRPHPRQLIEAWTRFRNSGRSLGCVQAPLQITNRGASIVARMFAFEYSGLFRIMLPFLSRNELVLPLGGTSNHFKRSVLEKVGGWDPFNVTEDADLGMRLHRLGYRTETIALPTHEAAPTELRVWLPQRTRWFKGWAQTWLVHMRSWRRLAAELGPGSFLVSQILFGGMLLSALLHPLLYVTLLIVGVEAAFGLSIGLYNRALLAVDVVNVALGYAGFLIIGARSLPRGERQALPLIAAATPVYWLMLSLAAWRAVIQLVRAPHLWEKTPHKRGEPDVPHAAAPSGWRGRPARRR